MNMGFNLDFQGDKEYIETGMIQDEKGNITIIIKPSEKLIALLKFTENLLKQHPSEELWMNRD